MSWQPAVRRAVGDWQNCYDRAREAEEILRDRHERLTWERDTAAIFKMDGIRWMGRWSEMKEVLPALLEDARARGDLYVESILQMQCGSCRDLANDDPQSARAGLKVLDRWSNPGFHVEHLVETHNPVEIALYCQNGREAFSIINSRWPELRKSHLLRLQTFNIHMRTLLARAALAAASQEDSLRWRANLCSSLPDAKHV